MSFLQRWTLFAIGNSLTMPSKILKQILENVCWKYLLPKVLEYALTGEFRVSEAQEDFVDTRLK